MSDYKLTQAEMKTYGFDPLFLQCYDRPELMRYGDMCNITYNNRLPTESKILIKDITDKKLGAFITADYTATGYRYKITTKFPTKLDFSCTRFVCVCPKNIWKQLTTTNIAIEKIRQEEAERQYQRKNLELYQQIEERFSSEEEGAPQ